jgi:hypothetical protein
MVELRWRDGRLFHARVQVWAGNRFLYRTHREESHRLCTQRIAIPRDESEGLPKIGSIILLRTPLERPVPNPNFSLASYSGGQRTVFKERLGPKDAFAGLRCFTLKRQEDHK